MRLFKTAYTDRTGKYREAKRWSVEFKDQMNTVRRMVLFLDQKASAEAGRKIERLVALRMAGEAPDTQLTRWIESIPTCLKTRLGEIGLIDCQRMAASKPLVGHIQDYRQALLDKGTSVDHADLVKTRISKLFFACEFTHWSDLNASKLSRTLADMRKDVRDKDGNLKKRGLAIQTSNFYLVAAKGFCRWMLRNKRATENPLDHLDGLNVKTDRRHDRRALTEIEVSNLVSATESGPERNGMTGPARAILYRLALTTGLRAGELRHLTYSSLDFDKQTVTLDAKHTKNRTACTLPLRNDMAHVLTDFTSDMLPTALLFKMPPKWDVIEMLKADLEAASVDYVDASGRFADFHALRHTFITNLARSGVHPKVAQDLARHSDIKLTMSRYSHTVLEQRAEAVGMLPEIKPTELKVAAEATRGEICTAECTAFSGGKSHTVANVDEPKKAVNVPFADSSNRASASGLSKITRENSTREDSSATLAQLVEQRFCKP